ncbi:hypothetical protein [Thermospira aquatica]|uniref:DUF4899 domain-containing protein n=1 Tax=Thermospira aquatica TaxID=2828656 RepID=A0AAX3BD75_9SPIR|nr:hypothetical protein [Thermospira aquatica]URA10197.1 hypothetical protein KDW03_12070 [Thermospira aquatica]
MGVKAEILVNNYGISQEFAQNLLDFFNGDVDKVIRIMESSDKDITVLKGKFIASRRNLYGAYVLFYNHQTLSPDYVYVVCTTDMNLSRIRIEDPWEAYIEMLRNYQLASESDPDLASRIEAQILSKDNVSVLTGYFSDRANPDLINLKRFFTNEVNRVIYDANVLVKFVLEDADIFRTRAYLSNTHDGLKVISSNPANLVLMNLKIEPVLSPLGGKDAESLASMEEVYVRVLDEREIVPELVEKLKPADVLSPNIIVGKVLENQLMPASENRRITLLFAPGIFGTFVIGGKVRVQTKAPSQTTQKSFDEGKKASDAPVIFSLNFDAEGNPIASSEENTRSIVSNSSPLTEAKNRPSVSSAIIVGIVGIAVLTLLILVFSFFLY